MKKIYFQAICLFFVTYLKAQTAVTIVPSLTDATITTNLDAHYTYTPSGVAKNKLVLFLPGTGAVPMNYSLFERTCATLGFHSIGLTYPNDVTINGTDVCGSSTDTSCYRKARLEVLTGQDLTTKLDINRANSIENRLIKLLKYLNTQSPTQGWGQYLNGDNIIWSKIITAGHSQGAGHAAFIAKTYKVDRALMFAWADWSTNYNTAAPWVSASGATPTEGYFAFIHPKDGFVQYATATTTWNLLGLTTFGKIISVDTAAGNFRGTHTLVTNQEPAFGSPSALSYHNMSVANLYSPTTNGESNFKSTWEYMLTTPLKTGIYEKQSDWQVNIYPNPVSNNILNIDFDKNAKNTEGVVNLLIFNQLGQVLMQKNDIGNTVFLDKNLFKAGIYYVKLSNKKGDFITKRLQIIN
jgi:Secretion system C-terminal sorting domain